MNELSNELESLALARGTTQPEEDEERVKEVGIGCERESEYEEKHGERERWKER